MRTKHAVDMPIREDVRRMLDWDIQAQPPVTDVEEEILRVEHLKMHFPVTRGLLKRQIGSVYAVDDVSFMVKRGQTLGIVGESGSGKSTIGNCVMRVYDLTDGSICFDGQEISRLEKRKLRGLRKRLQMITQDPYASLDPRKSIRDILLEGPRIQQIPYSREEQSDLVARLLMLVGLNPEFADRYPHEFSGGQRQRVSIARALAVNPAFLVCDEIVSALDVSIQAQVLNLFGRLQEEFGLTYVFISHDLSVIKHISDRIAIMYLGQVVELCGAEGIYDNPLHPYTRALLSAVPPSSPFEEKKTIELKGDIPSPIGDQVGCPLASRCPHCTDRCRQECPSLKEQEPGHQVACFLYES